MLKAGYRSVDSYLAAARTHNSELGYILPESLKHWMKGADRAARRGQGRALRAVVFDPVTAAAHCPTSLEQHTIRYGPELAWHSLVVGVWWMLREVELIELHLRSVKLHEAERRVEIRLGVTKTDIRGSGCIRAFDCTCSTALAPTLCPYHVLAYAVQRRLNRGASSEDPLFATPQVMGDSVRTTMEGAAMCDKHCELQDSVNQ